jgi:hypothetical protein
MFSQRSPAFVRTSACLYRGDAVLRSTLADVDKNRPLPPPWVIAGGIAVALALIFLLGIAYGQRPDWHIVEWHWGNILTVTVASIASVVVSNVTLKRNAAQFEQDRQDNARQYERNRQDTRNDIEQSRLDARNDKLRAVLIDLNIALAERRSQTDIVSSRILTFGKGFTVENPATPAEIEQGYKAILSEELWETYRRATSHAYGMLLLTEDTEVAGHITTIFDALAKERKLFEDLANAKTRLQVNTDEYPPVRDKIEVATKRLISYGLLNLGVRVHATIHEHPISSLFRP